MNLLAIETSSLLFSVALKTKQTCFEHNVFETYQTSQHVLPVIQDLLAKGELRLNELNALVLGAGPGSFTGLRIAGSVVHGLAFGCDLPVILISSLRACAQGIWRLRGFRNVLTAFNAYSGEVYWGGYQVDEAGLMQNVIADSLSLPSMVQMPDTSGWVGVGNGWDVYGEVLKKRCSEFLSEVEVEHYPTASALLDLAEVEYVRQNFVSLDAALPSYLRGGEAWRKT